MNAPPAAACQLPEHSHVDWFAERGDPGYDAGRAATAVCATCPMWESCVTDAVARREQFGIWGGAGGARRKALRRWWDTGMWPEALAAHGRALHGDQPGPLDRTLLRAAGDTVTHGKRGAQAKGCDCDPCALAAGVEGALHSAGRPRNIDRAATTWAARLDMEEAA